MSAKKTPSALSAQLIANARRLRKMRGWSAEELARRLTEAGCPTSGNTISNRERKGRTTNVTVDELFALADVFNRPVTDLVLKEAQCGHCAGNPPTGFTCHLCGTAAVPSAA